MPKKNVIHNGKHDYNEDSIRPKTSKACQKKDDSKGWKWWHIAIIIIIVVLVIALLYYFLCVCGSDTTAKKPSESSDVDTSGTSYEDYSYDSIEDSYNDNDMLDMIKNKKNQYVPETG